MSYVNKGTISPTVIVTREPDRSGNWVCDGTADDVQIQAAIDYVALLGGGKIFIKDGVYNISSIINLKANITLEGEGWGNYPHDTNGTVLKKVANINLIEYDNSGGAQTDTTFAIRNIQLFCDGVTYTGKGIYIDNCMNFVLDHVLITRARCAVHIKDSGIHFITLCRFIETYQDVACPYVLYEENSGDYQIFNNDMGAAAAHYTLVDGIYGTVGGGMISNNKIYLVRTGIGGTGALQIINNQINDFYQYGIAAGGGWSKVNDNFIYYIDAVAYPPAVGSAAAIVLNNNSITCEDNSIKDPSSVWTYGILEMAGKDNNVILGNLISGPTTPIRPVGANTIVRSNFGFVTENNVLSPAFAIDAVAVVAVVIPHGLDVTPAVEDCQLTVIEDTDVDDWEEGFVKVESTDAANVNCKVNVTALSATGGATAKLALHVTRKPM